MEKLEGCTQAGDWKQEKHVAAIECPAEILITN
jgi:desulfoferrodoxin (superoxide reductase-like protein)